LKLLLSSTKFFRMLSGMAVRHCIELGLHRQIAWTEGNVNSDALSMEMQRRVFWVSYNIDRASAMTLGRPISLHDSDIRVDVQPRSRSHVRKIQF